MVDFESLYLKADTFRGQMEKWYQDLHRIPEASLKEYKTTEYIEAALHNLGIESYRLDETGCIACIGGKKESCKREADYQTGSQKTYHQSQLQETVHRGRRPCTIALRADIDALPLTEDTGLDFSSVHKGYMHACGHDGHTAGLLGAAAVLKQVEEDLPVRVRLIFQASEENTLGAKRLIDLGILEDVDLVFGLHLFSDIPTGTISVDAGARMAQTDRFHIRFTGKGGHAAKPQLCLDATVMAAGFVTDLQSLVAREIDPLESAVATVGSFHSGSQYNVISGQADLEGTCRCYSQEISEKLEAGIRRKAKAAADSFGGQVQVDYTSACHPPVVNDRSFASSLLKIGKKRMGYDHFRYISPLMLGEDFSWYQKYVPGVFAFVGCGQPGQTVYPNHHPRFCIDKAALGQACRLHLCAVEAAAAAVSAS